MRSLIVALFLGGSLMLAADVPNKDAGRARSKVWAAISVNRPLFVAKDKPERLVIHFALVNDSDRTISPKKLFESSQLLINGVARKQWAFTAAQGPRDERWKALRPGDYIELAFALGDHFRKPGVYKVVWSGRTFQAPAIVFRVLSEREKT